MLKKVIHILFSIFFAIGLTIVSILDIPKIKIIYANFQDVTLSYEQYLDIEAAYEVMDENALVQKIDPLFQGGLSGQTRYFIQTCQNKDLPLDLALAITLHESAYGNSSLAVNSYNFGGLRSREGWASFASPQEGIDYYLTLLDESYYENGLTTPELIQPIYCPGSTSWVGQIYDYMNEINTMING